MSKVNSRQYIKKTSTGCRVGQDNHRLCVTRQLQTVCDKTTTVCDKATTDCVWQDTYRQCVTRQLQTVCDETTTDCVWQDNYRLCVTTQLQPVWQRQRKNVDRDIYLQCQSGPDVYTDTACWRPASDHGGKPMTTTSTRRWWLESSNDNTLPKVTQQVWTTHADTEPDSSEGNPWHEHQTQKTTVLK